jgi:16S rRNA (adenine1518-N6/adenine1519-N6)-dimethyltransferase
MKRRRLGQHYLVDQEVIGRIVGYASISPSDRILEIGTGEGALTKRLAGLGASYDGYEIDKRNFAKSLESVSGTRARIHHADAFKQSPEFDVLIASLPYSESSSFIQWLSVTKFDRAIVVLQEDFVRKILAPPGDRDYRGISALAQIVFDSKVLERVNRRSFSPPPRVNSIIAFLTQKRRIAEKEIANVMRLFSIRRKQVDSALAELGMSGGGNHGRRRVFSLAPEEVHQICSPPGSE